VAGSLLNCYLVDGQGMELHLRRQHPRAVQEAGGVWRWLAGAVGRPEAGPLELHLFGASGWQGPADTGAAAGRLRRVEAEWADWALWLKRDARKRTASCLYVWVGEDSEGRQEARRLGLSTLSFLDLDRRLGLGAAAAVAAREAAQAAKPPKTPSILKGGKAMSPAELRWWSEQLEVPVEPPAPDPAAAAAREEERLGRLLGAEPDDPRLLAHPEEDWLERNFPTDADDHRPRRPPKARRR
jgi:hypothetical protein